MRRNHGDSMAGEKSFLYGKSVENQRIEAWWGFLRKSIADWWMRFFKDLTDSGSLRQQQRYPCAMLEVLLYGLNSRGTV